MPQFMREDRLVEVMPNWRFTTSTHLHLGPGSPGRGTFSVDEAFDAVPEFRVESSGPESDANVGRCRPARIVASRKN